MKQLIATRGSQELYRLADGSAVIVDHVAKKATFPPSVEATLKQGYWRVIGVDSSVDRDIELDETEKHLSGQHNQQSHAGTGGGSYDPAGLYKGGKREVELDEGNNAQRTIDRLLGAGTTPEQIADLVAAPDGSTVVITTGYSDLGSAIFVDVSHPLYRQTQQRSIAKTHRGDLVMSNERFELDDSAPKGTGTSIFNRQVQACRKAGFKEIRTYAARGEEYNGYYSWPRMGYDADLPQSFVDNLSAWEIDALGARPRRISDLMKSIPGRELWQSNGEGMDMVFDLTDGSLSNFILDNYIKEKLKK